MGRDVIPHAPRHLLVEHCPSLYKYHRYSTRFQQRYTGRYVLDFAIETFVARLEYTAMELPMPDKKLPKYAKLRLADPKDLQVLMHNTIPSTLGRLADAG